MKTKIVWLVVGVVMAFGALACASHDRSAQSNNAPHSPEHSSTPITVEANTAVPAHYESEPPRSSLAATLEPAKFSGKTREAYRVVQEVPQLIAQLPCYCYCDRGFGHKSLHSCYVDDHAAHCAVCVDEVLIAYDLQKRGLSAEQIRERIIAQYGG